MRSKVDATTARAEFADTINRVAYGGERVVLERRGRPLAALVSIGDLLVLESTNEGEEPPGVLRGN
jgi:prevent-host-death family protein